MRDMSATNFTQFTHANTFFSCRFSALMRIDYMETIEKQMADLLKNAGACPANGGNHTFAVRTIFELGKILSMDAECQQCECRVHVK